jgi:hypothetical protein
MKRSIMRVAIGILGLGLVAGVGSGCTQKAHVPEDQMARIEAAANKAEAAANRAAAAAASAAEAAARAEAAVARIEGGWREEYNK